MRFKIDENLPMDVALKLRERGFDAMTVLEGVSDNVIAEVCKKEARTLITLDNDFADIIAYPPREYYGIIILQLRKQDKESILFNLERIIKFLNIEKPANKLWIVDDKKIRVRE
jgi:predicted nuclease of predicted toxin-antitoxin system